MMKYVLNRLVDMRTQAERAYLRDAGFRGLCDDYGEAIEALERWKSLPIPDAAERATEYSDLVAGLEEEIIVAIRNLRK